MEFMIENVMARKGTVDEFGLTEKADMVEMEVSEKTGALKEHYWVNLSRFNGMPGLIIAEESIVDALDRMTEEDIEHIQGIAIERYHGDTYESMEDTIEFSAFMSCYRFARYILEGMYRHTHFEFVYSNMNRCGICTKRTILALGSVCNRLFLLDSHK